MKKIILTIILTIFTSTIFANIQVNKRMDRQVGDFDEDQAYGEIPNKSPDLSTATENIQEVETPQIDYLNPPNFELPPSEIPPPAYSK